MTMLTPRANLLRTLRHERPEWIPVGGHVDPYNQPHQRGMDPALAAALREVRWNDESTVAFSRYLGLDITDLFGAPLRSESRRVTSRQERQGDVVVATWHTPAGDLRRVQRYSPGTGLWYTQEHMVKGKADLAALAALFEDQEFSLDPDGVAALRRRRELIGEDGIITMSLPGTPLGQMVRVHAGVENLAYLWADARAELHALFAVMADNHERQARLAASLPEPEALVSMDDTSTTTQSPAMFAEFCLGYTDRLADLAHAAGKLYLHHSCGLIRDLLPLYRQTRMDAVHAFSIPPLGDVTIAAGKAALGPRIAIMAGVVQLFGDLTDRARVAASLAAMFTEAGEENAIFWIAADPERDMEETRWVAEEGKRLGRMGN
jgi:hypothetical protein